MRPEDIFSLLSDSTRLRALALLHAEGELCVCELTGALDESQPKVSRHLALMREAGIVEARREGTWMHYRLSDSLPGWSREILDKSLEEVGRLEAFEVDTARLRVLSDRPGAPACA